MYKSKINSSVVSNPIKVKVVACSNSCNRGCAKECSKLSGETAVLEQKK